MEGVDEGFVFIDWVSLGIAGVMKGGAASGGGLFIAVMGAKGNLWASNGFSRGIAP